MFRDVLIMKEHWKNALEKRKNLIYYKDARGKEWLKINVSCLFLHLFVTNLSLQ